MKKNIFLTFLLVSSILSAQISTDRPDQTEASAEVEFDRERELKQRRREQEREDDEDDG